VQCTAVSYGIISQCTWICMFIVEQAESSMASILAQPFGHTAVLACIQALHAYKHGMHASQ
jgi:hypothetical protein